METDQDYRENQKAAQKTWRQNHGDYYKEYRKNHPEYVKRNREEQRRRNRKRKEPPGKHSGKIAKMDALDSSTNTESFIYEMTLLGESSKRIVKMDTLTVKMRLIPGGYLGKTIDCKERTQ